MSSSPASNLNMAGLNPDKAGNAKGLPKIVLYTNHGCAWSHRVHIALHELGLPYEEVILNLQEPRPEWFLKINPRGLVPAMKYTPAEEADGPQDSGAQPRAQLTLTESMVIVNFLLDMHDPTYRLPQGADGGALSGAVAHQAMQRARVAFFVETYFARINPLMFEIVKLESPGARDAKTLAELVPRLAEEIEPLLHDAGPFFGGSARLTLAEMIVAPWAVRIVAFGRDGLILPRVLLDEVDKSEGEGGKLVRFKEWVERCAQVDSVKAEWDEEVRVAGIRKYLYKLRPGA